MPNRPLSRRWFLSAAATGLAGWACAREVAAPAPALPAAGEETPASARLCPPGEPGEPLYVRGEVFAPDGLTPAPGVVVYLYHTDAAGLYGRPPRLRGWLRTDAEGRFAYRTIRPAPYPSGDTAAHVHAQLWSDRYPAQWTTALHFAGDPMLREEQKRASLALGRLGFIQPLTRNEEGVWCAYHPLCLKPVGDVFEPNIRHGLDDAPPSFRSARQSGER